MAKTLYEGPAHNATFHVPSPGIVRFAFSGRAAGYVRSGYGLLVRVEPGARLFLSAGEHLLTLDDPNLMLTRVSIVFVPDQPLRKRSGATCDRSPEVLYGRGAIRRE